MTPFDFNKRDPADHKKKTLTSGDPAGLDPEFTHNWPCVIAGDTVRKGVLIKFREVNQVLKAVVKINTAAPVTEEVDPAHVHLLKTANASSSSSSSLARCTSAPHPDAPPEDCRFGGAWPRLGSSARPAEGS